jgi:hypothetical protein
VAASNEELILDDVEIRQVTVRLGGKVYILREADGGTARAYRNAMFKGAQVAPDGRSIVGQNIADAELVLLNGCLSDPQGRRVPLNTLSTWPSRILRPLFVKAQEISDLRERDDSEVGLVKRETDLTKELNDVRGKLSALRVGQNGHAEDGTDGGAGADPDPTAAAPAPSTPG